MSQDRDDRTKLARLADAFMQDILSVPDANVIAEVGREGIQRATTIFIEVKMNLSQQLLTKAKAEHEAWRSSAQSRHANAFDQSAARDQFEKIRRGDPNLNQKITLAARNGKAPSDADVDGIVDDWADLQRLDGESTTE
jgi:hypothetical protein